MPDVAFIADAPLELAAAPEGQPARSRIHVAMLGSFQDKRYGTFQITQREVDNWKRLLTEHFRGRVPIDTDHATDKGISSEASGWITDLSVAGNEVTANVEWTPKGESAVRERRYLYISPTFVADLKDDGGKSLGPALLRAALTNNPFLHRMPAVTLSAHTEFAQRVADPITPPPDSRPAMSDHLKTLAAKLGLPDDADGTKILEAFDAVKAKADAALEKTDTRTLAAMAEAEGLVVLSKAEDDKRKLDAAAGVLALTQMSEQRFARTFDACVAKVTVDAKPETRAEWKELYDAAPDTTIKRLEALSVPVANNRARGEGGDASEVPAGYDAESVKLDRAVRAYMTEHKVSDYTLALSAVLSEQEAMVL